MRRTVLLVVIVAAALATGGCKAASEATPAAPPDEGEPTASQPLATLPGEPVEAGPTTTDSGLQYYVLAEGSGEPPATGAPVSVHYSGYLLDGTKFDSSVDRGTPFTFVLGAGQVIPGWDEGVALMRPGAKYKFVIPPELGYGPSGMAPTIPPDATLVFDVEMLAEP